MTLRGILLHLVILITAIRKRVIFLSISFLLNWVIVCRQRKSILGSQVWKKKVSSNSLINIYLLLNYKTLLKGHLANQWSLYTQPFLIYCFFYSVAFWLYQYVCLHSITKYHILYTGSLNQLCCLHYKSLLYSF